MRGGKWVRGEGVPLKEWCAFVLGGAAVVYVVIHWVGG